MAKTVTQLRAVALNSFQEILRKRVLYIIGILLVLVGFTVLSQAQIMKMAGEAGEFEGLSSTFPRQALGMWDGAATILALFLGATGISSEITGKTIVHVLSRPIARVVYLAGRWLGMILFLSAFQLVGILLALLMMRISHIQYSPVFWAGCAEMFVKPAFFSGVSLGLSVFLPPVLAGCCAFVVSFASQFLGDSLHHPGWALRQLANAAYYLLPAQMPGDLIAESFKEEFLHPKYSLYFQVMGENLGYTIAIFAVGCFIFARRELRLR